MEVSSIPKGCGLSLKRFVLSLATSLVHLCRLRDPETQRLSLQTLELLAIENSDVIIQHVCCFVCLCLFALFIYLFIRALDLRTRTSRSTRFNLNFSRVFRKKKHTPKSFILLFSQKKLLRLFILKESEMMKLHTFDNLFPQPTNDIRAKRMMTAITFSHQNDAASRVSNTQY